MKNLSIRQWILVSFTVVLAIIVAMGSVAYLKLSHIEQETFKMQTDTLPGVYFGGDIMNEWLTNYSLIQARAIETDPGTIRNLDLQIATNWANLNTSIKNYEGAIHQQKDRENFAHFKSQIPAYLNAQQQYLKAGAGNQSLSNHAIIAANSNVVSAIQTLIDFNRTDVDQATQSILKAIGAARAGILSGFLAAVLVSAFVGYLLWQIITRPLSTLVVGMDVIRKGDFSRKINLQRQDEFGLLGAGFDNMIDDLKLLISQVQKSGLQVSTSITEIAATSKQQQATANEIAATTTEISATSKEISATSRELGKTMAEVSAVAEQTAVLAGSGQVGLSRMEETMNHVVEAATSINSKLAVLNVKAGNINQVVITITKVADQTNLLSLNAAIEAEKAGEYGRGFAVVASEIRRLADQTAVATYDIELMVKEIQSAVSAGVMGMDKFSEEVRRGMQEMHQVGNQLSQIIKDVQTLVPRFETVNDGMQAQAIGAGQISEALGQLGEAAQQTVESLRQSSLTIDELNIASSTLRSSVSRFRLQE
ncbi:methyl-accepting chemotaxis protein [Terriglobus sp. 2YAB30_2]|uniref:methyl-accepting chemotaxis protein n=2 Tax=unclassified Terriglobus TaxID=2628988 RepID=UPI003F944DFC